MSWYTPHALPMTALMPLLEVQDSSTIFLLEAQAHPAADAAMAWSEAGLTVRELRGEKMRTTDALFDEFAAAPQFPYYFGENWSAFDKCLADIEWLLPVTGIVVLIRNAEHVLGGESAEELEGCNAGSTRRHASMRIPFSAGSGGIGPRFHFTWSFRSAPRTRCRPRAAGHRLAP